MKSLFDRPPEIDYLAKDYASFRQLMLDQISLLVPDWQERHPADLGNVLVEILAYAADYLSYYQEGVATEAYLGTARLRRSVRRHTRLLDYHLHNGCNARTWVHVAPTDGAETCLPKGTQLLTSVDMSQGTRVLATTDEADRRLFRSALQQGALVFQTLHDIRLYPAHSEIPFHVKDRTGTILAQGATSAFLQYSWVDQADNLRTLDNLKVGDVLILEERLDPNTGMAAGVDPTHRHAVRLTGIERLLPATDSKSKPCVRIQWDVADALPFDMPVGPYRAASSGADSQELPLSVAVGNIVLADHGRIVENEALPHVLSQGRYRPYLTFRDIAYAVPYDHDQACRQPASAALAQDPQQAEAVVQLVETLDVLLPEAKEYPVLMRRKGRGDGHDEDERRYQSIHRWTQQRDLLSSDQSARTFVVESEDDGRSYLRFGFGGLGKAPSSQGSLEVTYRVGNGSQGNIGRHAISHIVTNDPGLKSLVMSVRNPLPVDSGIDPEPIGEARLSAPYAFQAHLSCISPGDYAALATTVPSVLQARAQIEQTGNWQTVFVYVQRHEDQDLDHDLRDRLKALLQPLALGGYEVAVRPPRYVGLNLQLKVWVASHNFKNRVREAVEAALSNRLLDSDERGFFYPDNLTFGQSIYHSQVLSAVMAVDGVARVDIEHFGRQDDTRTPDPVPMGPLEIARLDNNPGRPERGTLQVIMERGT